MQVDRMRVQGFTLCRGGTITERVSLSFFSAFCFLLFFFLSNDSFGTHELPIDFYSSLQVASCVSHTYVKTHSRWPRIKCNISPWAPPPPLTSAESSLQLLDLYFFLFCFLSLRIFITSSTSQRKFRLLFFSLIKNDN